MAGNVNLIDPNDANTNGNNNVNPIPQYQDMFIDVELRAIKRGRTVLETSVEGNITKINDSASGNEVAVSFLGENQDESNPAHFNQFTTNYYDGSESTNGIQYEGFGITSIDIVVNSSYIPQINIEFVDVRGLAFFNQKNSPYRILFDFPPPIFSLSFKGYYGKAISYQMHLVKYNTAFKAETGNYHISAEFIAISYAPLTDIPFRYIVQAPLMQDEYSINSEKGEKPRNTLELIFKLQNLYSNYAESIDNDINTKKYEETQTKLNNYESVSEILSAYSTHPIISKASNPILFTRDEAPDSLNYGEIQTIVNAREYEDVLKNYTTLDLPRNVTTRLYLGYLSESNIPMFESASTITVDVRNNYLKQFLNEFRQKELLNRTIGIIGPVVQETNIPLAKTISYDKNAKSLNSADSVRYIVLDISDYYIKIYKEKIRLEFEKVELMNTISDTINDLVLANLGMKPTIYNIFNLLLNDVDTFFTTLRDTAQDAEFRHHVDYKSQILSDSGGGYRDYVEDANDPKKTTIYAFPLIINTETICNQKKEERVAPIELSAKIPNDPFPELVLVNNFIDSIIKYRRIKTQLNQKTEEDSRGNKVWIPFTPADSILDVSSNLSDARSPYWGVDSAAGGSSGVANPINTSQFNKLQQLFEIVLKRFYVISQNTIPYSFYNQYTSKNEDRKRGQYLYEIGPETSKLQRDIIAQSEAMNLLNSLVNPLYLKLLKNFVDETKGNLELFYKYLNESLPAEYEATPDTYVLTNGPQMYVTKEKNRYQGLSFTTTDRIAERSKSGENTFIDEFIADEFTAKYNEFIDKRQKKRNESTYIFTQENILYVSDVGTSNNKYETKFLANFGRFKVTTTGNIIFSINLEKKWTFPKADAYANLIKDGNEYFYDINTIGVRKDTIVDDKKKNIFHQNENILRVWSDVLGTNNSEEFYNDIIDYNSGGVLDAKLSALLYLSNFGQTTSPFNFYPNYLNRDYFTTPSIIELPRFVALYVGALVDVKEGDDFYNLIYNFFLTGGGSNIQNGGALIFADIHDINTYLSEDDKNKFQQKFSEFFSDGSGNGAFGRLAQGTKNLYDQVTEDYNDCLKSKDITHEYNLTTVGTEVTAAGSVATAYQDTHPDCPFRTTRIIDALDPQKSGIYSSLLEDLIRREGIICYNEMTFRYVDDNNLTTDGDYLSLSGLNTTYRDINDQYFQKFLTTVSKHIVKREEEVLELEKEIKGSTRDKDIINQTYYSFKNINDKWLAGTNAKVKGYPFKTDPNKGLVSQFAFVDRAMKPIGDTIIDPKALVDNLDNPDASIFTVISQLLSINGFEFFPLQSFLSFEENEWTDSFKIDVGPLKKQYPVFVCMYLGGSSSYPTGIRGLSPFEDDGIVDLENPGVDLFGGECEAIPENDNQLNTTDHRDMYNVVRAFKVRYAEQNQNMFYDVKIDSKEYPETNESIQLLSRLAGDGGPQAPIPKGQNLYNVYENRAYKATITGLGNAMIQPTQYFQLENIPMFDGAYIVLTVEHNIVPNKMTTKFSGTKLLKYPMPRVLEAAAIVGFEGGSSDSTNSASVSANEITLGVGTAANPDQAKYNSMYILEIGY